MNARTNDQKASARRRCVGPGAAGLKRVDARRAGNGGVTLMELLLALMVSGLVGAAVALMLSATSYGTSSQAEKRSMLVTNEIAAGRLGEALRRSKMVLAKGEDYLVLWMADTSVNDVPNLSELHRIERDPTTDELQSYRAPADLASEDDVEYDLGTTDFNAVTGALKDSAYFPGTLWATEVTAWTTTVPTADVRQANFVGYRITTTSDGASETKIGGMKLRNH